MSTRSNILGRIRNRSAVATDLTNALSPPVPANAIAFDRDTIVDVFKERAELSGSIVQLAYSSRQLDAALDALNHTTPLTTADRQLLAEFPKLTATGAEHHCTLVRADAAIAETGTVCLHSAQVPSRSLFLCEQLAVLINGTDIVRYQEEYWCRHARIPRAVHLITGPSRTADVEQTLQIGAHGPKRVTLLLCVWL